MADPSFAYARVPVALRVLVLGAAVGALTYLLLQLFPDAVGVLAQCTGCNATDRGDVLAAITTAGATVGTYAAKSTFDKWAGKALGSTGPANIFKVKKIIEIGSAKTDEEAAERAMDAYKDLIMIKDMPEGSTGDELSDAIDRFTDFATGRIEINGGDDDDL